MQYFTKVGKIACLINVTGTALRLVCHTTLNIFAKLFWITARNVISFANVRETLNIRKETRQKNTLQLNCFVDHVTNKKIGFISTADNEQLVLKFIEFVLNTVTNVRFWVLFILSRYFGNFILSIDNICIDLFS